jgi:hypothetical protein
MSTSAAECSSQLESLTRRRVLALLASLPLWPTAWKTADAPVLRIDRWRHVLVRGHRSRKLGRSHLASSGEELTIEVLLDALEGAVELAGLDPASATPASLKRGLRQAMASEFESEDVVFVDGWLLARSEARLYALHALVG